MESVKQGVQRLTCVAQTASDQTDNRYSQRVEEPGGAGPFSHTLHHNRTLVWILHENCKERNLQNYTNRNEYDADMSRGDQTVTARVSCLRGGESMGEVKHIGVMQKYEQRSDGC